LYDVLAVAMKQAAKDLGVSIVWGGDWVTFKDGPHFELDRKVYP
jgi:peptidoglycan L-alanyl-D-glutamate endopeptidase CwlK